MSLKISEVAFIGYPVTEINRARDFYERILGLTVGEIDHEVPGMPGKFWVEYEIGSQTFAISNTWEPAKQAGPSVALEVKDFQGAMDDLKKEGVKIVADCIETPVCRIGVIEDPDGNGIMIHKRH